MPDFISKFIFDAEIDKEKINSYDDYINKMVTLSDFDYETDDERTLSIGVNFIPIIGQYKMAAEIIEGKDLVSGRHYSIGEQLFAVGTVGAVSLLGKIYKGVKVGRALGVEETTGKVSEEIVFAMNGVGKSSGIENLAKNITKKIIGNEKGIAKGAAKPIREQMLESSSAKM
ncbi:pre-toxin TG domain-containing protein [Clostridium brassicae]|uniref:Pre-toxin TG domain-containing protein n=1 Tax=Clostridium brassicae TaxID=2999072 RepID=A0ABT4D4J2_9CLOT|nr:pre-toxin TG domain-containing protein [Clostridium brassicae]MCY6957200.1 pre-toxin TG domain-containing protein [Clostridium brassicae]